MGRKADDFSVILRKDTGYYFYRLKDWPRGMRRPAGTKNKKEAYRIAAAAFQDALRQNRKQGQVVLREYLEPFFVWDRCPHVLRLREEGKSISPDYVKKQRRRLETYVLSDRIVDCILSECKRADILDFRRRLVENGTGSRTVNMTIGVMKIVFREAYYREEIDRDPTLGVGEVKYQKKEVGIFTEKEFRAIFKDCPGIFDEVFAYTAFLLAASMGMRRSEVLALAWEQIDFETQSILIDRAFTDNGLPKWNKIRGTPLPTITAEALRRIRSISEFVLPHQPVICYLTGRYRGRARGETWWEDSFRRAMVTAGLIESEKINKQTVHHNPRNLRPHSFRHTLNTMVRGAGEDPAKIRAALGWSDERVQDGYTHWQPEHFEDLRKRVDELFG